MPGTVYLAGRQTNFRVHLDEVILELFQRRVDAVTHVLRRAPDMHAVCVDLNVKVGGEEHVLPLAPFKRLAT